MLPRAPRPAPSENKSIECKQENIECKPKSEDATLESSDQNEQDSVEKANMNPEKPEEVIVIDSDCQSLKK